MKFLGNILWLVLGGLLVAMFYYLVGLLICLTIIGIPFGVQLFKFGTFALWPFGHDMVYRPDEPGCLSLVMNVLWILLGWWEIALIHAFFGLVLCVTIVGIPWGMQHFKMAKMSLFPFGKVVK
ncbi:MAG: YccF domain-containing protein [Bacteroidales bacterium]|nr:YccF domain-containing protein [Bacteroidales bacterium]